MNRLLQKKQPLHCLSYKKLYWIIIYVGFPYFRFLSKYVIFTPNTGHYTPKSPQSSPNCQICTLESLSGYVPMRSVMSVCQLWGGRWYWNPSSVEHPGVRLQDRNFNPAVNPTFNVQNGFFSFAAMSRLKVTISKIQ